MIDIIDFTGEKFNLGFSKVLQTKHFAIVKGGSDEVNRKSVENKQVDILLSPERNRIKNYTHQENSGLNQILCKLAKKNKVAVGFSFSELLNSKDKPKTLARILQNIKLCRKYNVKIVIASFAKNKWEMRSAHDLLSFGKVLGLTPKEAKKALNFQKKMKSIKVISPKNL